MINQPDGSHELIVLVRAYQVIMETNSLAVVKDIRDRAEALRKFAKSAAKGFEIQNKAAEIRLRAERKAGILLLELHLHGGDRRSSTHDEHLNLEKMGINRNHSQRWQHIAGAPEVLFEGYLRECNELEREITSADLLRIVRRRMPRSPSHQIKAKIEQLNKAQGELVELVRRGGTFSCISVYPPWPKPRRIGKENKTYRPEKRFVRQLGCLPIPDLAAENCHLHLWSTSEHLWGAFRLMVAWGFKYRDILTCVRPVHEYGAYWHSAQDFLVLGTKGHRHFKDNGLQSLVEADRGSQCGAQQIRQLIERVSLGPYLEVFSDHAGSSQTIALE